MRSNRPAYDSSISRYRQHFSEPKMSRGPGIVQRQLLVAFEAEPTRRFTTMELAEIVCPGEAIGGRHRASLFRALRSLPGVKLFRCPVGKPGRTRPRWF